MNEEIDNAIIETIRQLLKEIKIDISLDQIQSLKTFGVDCTSNLVRAKMRELLGMMAGLYEMDLVPKFSK